MQPIAAKLKGIREGSEWRDLDESVVILGVFADTVVLLRANGDIDSYEWQDVTLNAKVNVIPVTVGGGIPFDGRTR